MPVDRLAELRKTRAHQSVLSIAAPDIEMGSIMTSDQEFLMQLEQLRSHLAPLPDLQASIQQQQTLILNALDAQSMQRSQKTIDQLTESIEDHHCQARRLLSALEKGTQDAIPGSAQHRMRTTQYRQVASKFLQMIESYHQGQVSYKARRKQQLARQLKLMQPNASEEQIEEMVENGEPILFSQSYQTAQQDVAALNARHKELLDLEQNILSLHQLMMDMSLLVDQQGDLVNHIEHNVQQSEIYTAKANVELHGAVQSQKSAWRKKWMIFGCCLLILVVVALVIYFVVLRGGSVSPATVVVNGGGNGSTNSTKTLP